MAIKFNFRLDLFVITILLLLNSCQFSGNGTKVENGKVVRENLLKSIDFIVKATSENDLEIYEDGLIPWINIEAPENDIPNLIDGNKIILKVKKVAIIIDYPLNNPIKFYIETNKKEGFSKIDLIRKISSKYHQIYKEEEESAKIKTTPIEERLILNRNQTDGKYGIWGHDLGDLDLSSIYVVIDTTGEIALELNIDS